MHRRLRLWVIALLLFATYVWLGAVTPASAVPIAYDEAIHGELDGQNIGIFDVGGNTVAGAEAPGIRANFDIFFFTVPPGLQLDSIVLSSMNVGQVFFLAPWSSPFPPQWSVFPGPWSAIATSDRVGVDLLPEALLANSRFPATAPLPAALYQVVLATTIVAATYQYSFNVSDARAVPAIPEPATLILFGTGLAGIAARARRGRRLRQ